MGFLRCCAGIPLVAVCLCFVLLGASAAVGGEVGATSSGDAKVANDAANTAEELLGLVSGDRFLGNTSAPVVMVEYASFACAHCADFATKVLPRLKSEYIDRGKLLYILRDFPLDRLSLTAAMLGSCYKDNRAFFAYAKAVFNSFDALIATHKDLGLLANIAKISNISDEEFKRCTTDEALMDSIVQKKFLAVNKLDVNATPAFFLNGQRYDGGHDFGSISEEIERLALLHPNYSALDGKATKLGRK
ncbi:DsbA family protein [Anaplasma capra]|uniref:DsbA family protein n=1 Tax=Anaplasma capra TaxID=1562740 RepID=UPI0021D611AD|nr:DsbA family protein [Anaplasma capra]MCU7611750.1 DsbA family protein [Anaplasma capra]MCU7612499.1 DsbA family protein [Anaplasma capra]